MRKLFPLFILVSLIIMISSCKKSKVTVYAGGYACEVDTFAVNHYSKIRINQAIERNDYVQSVNRPSNSSSFGNKKAEVRWRVFSEDQKASRLYKIEGEATVVHYEHGIEIIKDGNSWFYDGFEYNEDNLTDISAAKSIFNEWEPVKIGYNGSDLAYTFLYPRHYHGFEEYFIMQSDLKDIHINLYTDALIRTKIY